jgi:uncharacterized protein with ParB-like and HNH nuclease domain
MALSLSAEQKTILNILKIDEQYIIPAYQRPYSWGYDQCFQLYNDLMNSYCPKNPNNSSDCDEPEEYFIGNIIIAKSENNKYELDVIDGQQRLTTLFLMIKVLSIFTEDELYKEDFKKILGGINRRTREYEYRIKPDILESKTSNQDFIDVLKYEKKDFEKVLKECSNKKNEYIEKKCLNRFQKNIIYFYNWFNFFIDENNGNIEKFIYFLLEKVYLLPIELTGKTRDDAKEKALVIFETINNRGMNLEDADIFKAKLYGRAEKIGEEGIFLDLWKSFKNDCENLKIDIDDVFRYYSHIIRGEKGITSGETNLRKFFTTEKYSPFNLKKYKEIMDDLGEIIAILEFINQEKSKESELAKWLQLIEVYTNQYPKQALVVYLFVNSLSPNKEKLYYFLESLVRYTYYEGSTTRIKFEIYKIIKQISNRGDISSYVQKNIDRDDFNYLGNLKYGYALLAFYVDRDTSLDKYYFDKIISLKDEKDLSWGNKIKVEDFINNLGNFIVLDIPRRNRGLKEKINYYKESKLNVIKSDAQKLSDLKEESFIERDKKLKEKLVKFFRGDK